MSCHRQTDTTPVMPGKTLETEACTHSPTGPGCAAAAAPGHGESEGRLRRVCQRWRGWRCRGAQWHGASATSFARPTYVSSVSCLAQCGLLRIPCSCATFCPAQADRRGVMLVQELMGRSLRIDIAEAKPDGRGEIHTAWCRVLVVCCCSKLDSATAFPASQACAPVPPRWRRRRRRVWRRVWRRLRGPRPPQGQGQRLRCVICCCLDTHCLHAPPHAHRREAISSSSAGRRPRLPSFHR